MSYGNTPGGEQDYSGQGPGFGEPFPGQGGAAGPPGWQPGQQAPFGYGAPGYGVPPGPPPPTYRVWLRVAGACAVLFNVIFGLPAAIIGSRYSKTAAERWASGDVQAAVSASRRALGWLIASIAFSAVGLIVLIVYITQASSQPDYNNPSVVAASIKTQLQQRLSDKSGQYYEPGVTVTSVVCTPSGTSTDTCVITLSNGQNGTTTAVITNNGTGYHTQ